MKKIVSILSLLAFVIVLFNGAAFCQKVNLSGTWIGETEVPEGLEPDKVTLVLKKTNGEYTGNVTDSMGMAVKAELEDIEFEDNELTANFMIFDGYENARIYFTLTVEGDTMKGFWESESGDSAIIELHRQK
ncbi:MAG: hypothetical protein KAU47_07330 [Candidatus Aminicenantes bacterium]|nr:hypothetical protein [Candidatus Aminicenantes bacterium]